MPIENELLAKVARNDPSITNLDLSNQGITDNDLEKLCAALKTNTHVEILNLYDNNISDLKPFSQLSQLSQLQVLLLSFNQITAIEGLDNLVNLQRLYLDSNKITTIQGLYNLVELYDLFLPGNQITAIQGLDGLANLRYLSLGKNKITTIPVSHLSKFTKLAILNLKDNCLSNFEIQKVKEIFKNNTHIQLPEIDTQNLNKPEVKSTFVGKKDIGISFDETTKGFNATSFQSTHSAINNELLAKLANNDPSITKLDLSNQGITDNDLERLCTALKTNTHVKILNLNNNKISDLRPFSQLLGLVELHLNSNKITTIQGLYNLVNLQTLSMSYNQITAIQGLDGLVNLRYLDLSGNKITAIQRLDNLTNLWTLILDDNQITAIQKLDNLVNLQILELGQNKITIIQGLYNLVKLDTLVLNGNQITIIQGLDSLVDLRYLALTCNKISTFQASYFSKFTKLTTLDIKNNCLSNIEIQKLKEIFKGNTQIQMPEIDIQNLNKENVTSTFNENKDTGVSFDKSSKEIYTSPLLNNSAKVLYSSVKATEIKTQPLSTISLLAELEQEYKQELTALPINTIELAQAQQQLQKQLQESQEQQQQLLQQLKTLQSQPLASAIEVEKLQTNYNRLHEQHAKLQIDYELKAAKKAAIETYRGQPNLWRFYRTVYIRLEEIFIGCKSVASELVDTSHTGNLGTAATGVTILGKVLSLIPAFGSSLDTVVSTVSDSLAAVDQERQNNILKAISALGTLTDMKQAAENTARLLTDRYHDQVQALLTAEEEQKKSEATKAASTFGKVNEGVKSLVGAAKEAIIKEQSTTAAEDLANFAVTQVLGALLDGSIKADQPDQSLTQQFLKTVTVEPSKLDIIKEAITNKLGLTVVETRDGKVWQLHGIFRKAGISTAEGEYYQGGKTEPELYGYRLGTAAEAKALGLSLTKTPVNKDQPEDKKADIITTTISKEEYVVAGPSSNYQATQQQLKVETVKIVTSKQEAEDVNILNQIEMLRLQHEKELKSLREQQETKERAREEEKLKRREAKEQERLQREAKERERDVLLEKLQRQVKAQPVSNEIDVVVDGGRDAQLKINKESVFNNATASHHPLRLAKDLEETKQQIGELGQVVASLQEGLGHSKNSPTVPSHADEKARARLLGLNPNKVPKSSSSTLFKKALKTDEKIALLADPDEESKKTGCSSCNVL